MRVLLVEDSLEVGPFLKQALEGEGHTVDWVTSPHEAIMKAMADTPNLVIMDMMLPEKDGIDLASNLRSSGLSCPFIGMTASDHLFQDAEESGLFLSIYPKPEVFKPIMEQVRAL